jgi:hypothetical protein
MAVKTLKQEAQEFLQNVPEEYVFRVVNGHTLRSEKELADELKTMSESDYSYHANGQKNDFALWVKDIIKDDTLARDLQRAPNKNQAAKAAASRFNILSKRLA